MNVYKTYGIITGLTLLLAFTATGQEVPVPEKVPGFNRFVSYTTHLDSLIFNNTKKKSPQIDVVAVNTQTISNADSIFGSRFGSLKKETKSITGLDLSGSYNYKLGSRTNDDEIDVYSPYTNRFQLGVNWDFINSGLYKQNKKLKLAELENEQLKSDYLYALKGQSVEETRQNIADFYGSQIYQLQSIRFGLFDFLKKLLNRPESEEGMTLYLSIQDQWAAIRNELNSYNPKRNDRGISEIFNVLKETPMLDSVLFVQQVTANNKSIVSANQDKAILTAKKNMISYTDKMKVSPFVRGQHYVRPSNTNPSTSVDLGVNVSVPLSAESKYKKKSLLAEQNVADINLQQITDALLFKAQQILEKQDFLLLSLHQSLIRLNILKHNILNNQLVIRYNNDYFSAPKIIFTYDDYFKELIRLYQLKQEYMTLLADASDLSGGTDLQQMTFHKDLAYQDPEPGRTTREVLLIQPGNTDPAILANIMWRNRLDAGIVIEAGKPAEQYNDLFQQLSLYDIETALSVDGRQLLIKSGNDLTEELSRIHIIPVKTLYLDIAGQAEPIDIAGHRATIQEIRNWGKTNGVDIHFIIPYQELNKIASLQPEAPLSGWVLKITPAEEAAFRNQLEKDSPSLASIGIQVVTNTEKWQGEEGSESVGRILTDGDNYLKTQYPLSVGSKSELSGKLNRQD